jgi:hypothetical protein
MALATSHPQFLFVSSKFYRYLMSLLLLVHLQPGEDPVCKFPAITEECQTRCTSHLENYKACVGRIQGKKDADCEAWYFDNLRCLDKCVSVDAYCA